MLIEIDHAAFLPIMLRDLFDLSENGNSRGI